MTLFLITHNRCHHHHHHYRRHYRRHHRRPASSLKVDTNEHDDVIKWKHFPRYWPFVRGIHRSPVNSTHKDQWRGALMFTLICARINGWVNNRKAGDMSRYRTHYDVIVMQVIIFHIKRLTVFIGPLFQMKLMINMIRLTYRGRVTHICVSKWSHH